MASRTPPEAGKEGHTSTSEDENQDSLPPHLLRNTRDETREERELRESLREIAQNKEEDLIEHCVAQIKRANRLKEEESTMAMRACRDAAKDLKKSKQQMEMAKSQAEILEYNLTSAREEIERLNREIGQGKLNPETREHQNMRKSTQVAGNIIPNTEGGREVSFRGQPHTMSPRDIPNTSSPTSRLHHSMNDQRESRDNTTPTQHQDKYLESFNYNRNQDGDRKQETYGRDYLAGAILEDTQIAASSGLLEMGKMMEALLDRTNTDLTREEKSAFKEGLATIVNNQTQAIQQARRDTNRANQDVDYQPLTHIYPEPHPTQWPKDLPSTRSYGISTFEGTISPTLDLELAAWLGDIMKICKSKRLSHEQAIDLMSRHLSKTAKLTFDQATNLPAATLSTVVAHLETVYGQVMEPDEAQNAIASMERGKDTLTGILHKLTHLSKMATRLLPPGERISSQDTLIRTHFLRMLDPKLRYQINEKLKLRRLVGQPELSCAVLCKEAQEMEKAYGPGKDKK